MLFSEYYNIKKTTQDDWFDPIMDYDTPLFIDPFLIFENNQIFFDGAHKKVIKIFENFFLKVAEKSKYL